MTKAKALTLLPDSFAEYDGLKALLDEGARWFETRSVATVEVSHRKFELFVAGVGSSDPQAPAIGFFGGIHGLERIGTQLMLDYMRALLSPPRMGRTSQRATCERSGSSSCRSSIRAACGRARAPIRTAST